MGPIHYDVGPTKFSPLLNEAKSDHSTIILGLSNITSSHPLISAASQTHAPLRHRQSHISQGVPSGELKMKAPAFGARSAGAIRLFYRQQPRRMFATPSTKAPSQEQAHPIGAFYESIMNKPQPIPAVKPEEPPSSATKTPEPEAPAASPTPAKRGRKPKAAAAPAAADNDKSKSVSPEPSSPPSPSSQDSGSNDVQARARVVFGSSLAGPAERAERLAAIREQSRMVAGVLIPPRPEEPDNCCMSGCVNCVWDRYRDEMEHWSMATAEAERRQAMQDTGVEITGEAMAAETDVQIGAHELDERGAVSMDDDGGGSDSEWGKGSSGKIAKDFWDDSLYQNLPVGIREFMKQEKRLKEKHLREGTSGG